MADPLETGPIPDTPPPKSSSKPQLAMKSIAAIKAECDAKGLTSKYAKCAILAVVGGESGWVPLKELYPHSLSQLTGPSNIFSRSRDPQESAQFCKGNNKSRLEYFGWLYGTSWKPPKPVSNGNYYGRGFIQLTHKENYEKIGKLIGVDLVNKPELLEDQSDEGIAVNAKYVVAFIQSGMPDWNEAQWKSNFMERVLNTVKGSHDSWNKKRGYNEYFLGGKPAAAPTDKDPTSTTVNKTAREIETASPNKREAYAEDRSANFSTVGFADPEGKYPLRDYMNEPDTNRLARGILDGTSVNFKDASRKRNIPTAMGGAYDQPESAYNTVYPLNKVFESESGHVLEFDDSPDGERINLYHKKGTFIEIDPNGSQINYIVGDGFYITERNGNIFINGTCNITSTGPTNILCQGNAQIEVDGQTDIVLHNHANIGVALDLNIAVGGDMNVLVEGNYNLEVGKTSNTRSIGTMSIESTDALKLKTAKTMSMEGGDTASTAETLMKMSSSFKLETPADFQIKANTFTLDIATDTKIKTKTFLLETEETTKIKTDKFQLDGTTSTDILTGMFNTTTTMGVLQLNSLATAVINAPTIISMTSAKIDLNGAAIPPVIINAIEDKVEPLVALGAPKVPVDFKGDVVEGREKEQVLVDTVLNPIGEYNPNTLPITLMDSILDNIPLVGGLFDSLGVSASNLYDKKYAVTTIESKTSLSTAGVASKRNIVPPVDGPHQEYSQNMVPPERHSDSVSKYENAEDWNTPEGQKAWNRISSTSDYEHNNEVPAIPTDSSENVAGTGGSSSTSSLSAEKLADINGKEDYPLNYPLSKHFTLGMLVVGTNKFKAQKVGSTFYTKQMIVVNLCELCENILEPIWNEFGPCRGGGQGATWYLAEGFRSQATEGGSATSHHLAGRAADIHLIPDTKDAIFDAAVKIEKIVPYQEFFMEYARGGASHWIHISYDRNNKSKELQTWVQHSKRSNGLVKLYSGDSK